MLRFAIVDDDKVFIIEFSKLLSNLMTSIRENFTIESYDDSVLFLEEQLLNPFDLVFLDMDMPQLDGIAVAERIARQDSNTSIIVVTNHEHYARIGYRYNVFRFVRKEFLKTDIQEPIGSFLDKYSRENHMIPLELDRGIFQKYSVNQISYFYSSGHYIYLKLYNEANDVMLAVGKYTMNQLEKELCSLGFLRIHRTYLVNFHFIATIQKDQVSVQESQYKSIDLPLSHRKASEIRQKFKILSRGEDKL